MNISTEFWSVWLCIHTHSKQFSYEIFGTILKFFWHITNTRRYITSKEYSRFDVFGRYQCFPIWNELTFQSTDRMFCKIFRYFIFFSFIEHQTLLLLSRFLIFALFQSTHFILHKLFSNRIPRVLKYLSYFEHDWNAFGRKNGQTNAQFALKFYEQINSSFSHCAHSIITRNFVVLTRYLYLLVNWKAKNGLWKTQKAYTFSIVYNNQMWRVQQWVNKVST